RTWHTTKWHHRLFATLFGMVVVDAYSAYQYEATAADCLDSSIADFNSFISQLSYQLIFNDFTMQRSTRVGTGHHNKEDAAPTHTLRAFSTLEQYPCLSGMALRAQRKCGVCGKK
ncbi:hypothetical protein PHYSODRAFT_435314, partial [Phytophthora sojae]